jgi:tetratricopeptide (TPR) repeat protein
MRHRASLVTVLALLTLVTGANAVRATDPVSAPPAAPAPTPLPDATLMKVISRLRETPIGNEPAVVTYLDRIQAGHATAPQVNDFSVYLAKRGMPKVGIVFQEYGLKLDPKNTTLWLNLGTMQENTNQLGPAADAFKKAIELDAGNAAAHYSLGSVYDTQKHYDEAIEEYRRALVLDPALADPRKNPQVVNNENLMAVKLQIYQNQAGSLGLPLLQIQKPSASAKPVPDKQ